MIKENNIKLYFYPFLIHYNDAGWRYHKIALKKNHDRFYYLGGSTNYTPADYYFFIINSIFSSYPIDLCINMFKRFGYVYKA